MRTLLLFTLMSCWLSASAKESGLSGVTVLSDQLVDSIPNGYYLLTGTVRNAASQIPLGNAPISAYGKTDPIGKTSISGKFSLVLPLTDSNIRFQCGGYQVAWFEHYQIISKHHIELQVDLQPEDSPFRISVDKPVIYAYAQESVTASLQLLLRDQLKFIYPKPDAHSTWHFTTSEHDMLQIKDGAQYPYLFWESERNDYQTALKRQHGMLEGFLIPGNEVTAFLNTQLDYLGLNDREKTDFITYWGPRMQDGKYVFIQFQQDDECRQFADYRCTPAPSAVNRLYMLFHQFESLPENVLLMPQDLKPMQREGFYLVEWGGMEITSLHILPPD